MKEQFYINGVLMEQAEGKSASLVYQSPFFTDIDNIVSNRTNAVEFPATPGNLEAIDNIHLPGSTSRYAYRRHKVLYYRDGIQVFAGYGTLLSLTATAIKFSFTWGNVNTFKALLDMKLRNLTPTDEQQERATLPIPTHVNWTAANINASRFFDAGINFGGSNSLPVMPVADLLEVLQERSGVSIENASIFSKYCIPLVTKNGDALSKEYSGLQVRAPGTLTYVPKVDLDSSHRIDSGFRFTILTQGAGDADPKGWYSGDGIYDVSDVDILKVKLNSMSFRTQCKSGSTNRIYWYGGFAVYAVDEDGNNFKYLGGISVPYTYNSTYIYYNLTQAAEQTINVADYRYIVFRINACGRTEPSVFADVENLQIDFRAWATANENVEPGAPFPLWPNLPDWTCSQLLKNLMKIEGVFPVCPDENTIRFISIDSLYTRRAEAADWTSRLMGKPTEQTASFGSYAQENICNYAEDETVAVDASGVITVAGENLEKESNLITLDFAPTFVDSLNRPYIMSWAYNSEDSAYEFQEVKPRILQKYDTASSGQARHSFAGLAWSELIASRYYYYQQTIKLPKVLKASVRMDAADLLELDLTQPVYFYQLGHYYAVIKVTTKDNNTADVELLQLGEVKEQSDLPTGTNQLIVAQDAIGNWYATLKNYSGSTISDIIASPNYKVCLLRHGFARRGKTIVYDPDTHPYGGDETPWSHASRRGGTPGSGGKANYKNLRGGLNYRIIGQELLTRHRDHWINRSQTATYYTGSELVFDLLDTITLPPLRTGRRVGAKTKDGRYRNRASDGLTDLYIALYMRDTETNKWTRISNLVQVRGRTADKTAVWEFIETNLAYE